MLIYKSKNISGIPVSGFYNKIGISCIYVISSGKGKIYNEEVV